jgi:hypothetical protein
VRSRNFLVSAALATALAACGGGATTARPAGGPSGTAVQATAPASAVEQFIGYARQAKYTEMGYLFGTARGPLAESQAPERVARRMEAIASVLRAESYALNAMVNTPGRPEARTIMVELRQGRQSRQVPFIVVQGPAGTWLVEMVDMQAAIRPRS